MDIQQIKNPDLNFRQRNLIFLDLETTGFSVDRNEILDIGALKVENNFPFKILGEFELQVKPTHLETADKESLKIVRFSETAWQNAKDLNIALSLLDNFGSGGILVGFNISFDWATLTKAYSSLGRTDPFYYHRLDIMTVAFTKLYNQPTLKRFSLGELCKFFQIDRSSHHQALSDIKATYEVFKKLMDMA